MKKNHSFLQTTLLVVNTGSPKKRFILQKLNKMGLTIVMLSKEKNWATPYVDHWILADTNNHAGSLQAIFAFLKQHPQVRFDGAVTYWEDDVLLCSKIVDELSLTGISYTVANLARNKYLFREFCRQRELPAPKHLLLNGKSDLDLAAESLTFPLVIKPIYGSSSAFVVKVNSLEELHETYDYIAGNLSVETESALSSGLSLMAEEYIDGDEVDIDIILQNGKVKFYSIADNYKTTEPFFIETTHALPSHLPQDNQRSLIEMAEEILEQLGVQNACIHFEAKMTKTGPVPLEVNLRIGGDEVYASIKNVWGVDMIELLVLVATGTFIKVIHKDEPKKHLLSQTLQVTESGVLSKVDIDPELKNKPYVEDLYFGKEIGDPILVPPEGFEYLGWLSVSGDNLLDAQDNLQEAMELVKYDVVKYDPASSIGKTKRRSRFGAASLQKNIVLNQARIESIRRISKSDLRQLHIGIAGNSYPKIEGQVETELSQVSQKIQATLQEVGYKTTFIDFNNLPAALKILEHGKIDLIFNVCERVNNSSLLEPHPAAFFDAFQIPYTGSNPFTLALCMDKIKVKKLLQFHNIPTPKWDYAYSLEDEISDELDFPLIVKPAQSDNSIGITNESIVTNEKELEAQLKYVITSLKQPALVEEFIEGDEYDVSILGSEQDDLQVLPLSRSIFTHLPKGLWHIYPFSAKYENDPIYKDNIDVQRPPRGVEAKLQSLVSEIALDTYNILDCHDYGRIEVRVDKHDNPYVLELNPNPSINIRDCLPAVAQLAGMSYVEFLETIIGLALKRYQNRPAYYHLQPNTL